MHDHPSNGPRDPDDGEQQVSSQWAAPGIMVGPIKSVVFFGEDAHDDPCCLFARAHNWLHANPDWNVTDVAYGFGRRGPDGVEHPCLRLYVEDGANQVQPIMVLDEPDYERHKQEQARYDSIADMNRAAAQGLDEHGFGGFVIDPETLVGTRDQVVERLRAQGVPEMLIQMMVPSEGPEQGE